MAEEIAVENGRISNFQGLVTLTLDRVNTAYHRASLVNLYLHAKFHWNQRNGWMDGRIFETHCISSTQKSRPKNTQFWHWTPCCILGHNYSQTKPLLPWLTPERVCTVRRDCFRNHVTFTSWPLGQCMPSDCYRIYV